MDSEKTRTIRKLMLSHLGEKAMLTQADRMVLKFGGLNNLHQALVEAGHPLTKVTIYRWNHPKNHNGGGGVIPKTSMAKIIVAARLQGIILTAEDLDPRPIPASGKYVPNDG